MEIQKTLSIIKPDAMKLKYSGKIIDFIEDKMFHGTIWKEQTHMNTVCMIQLCYWTVITCASPQIY